MRELKGPRKSKFGFSIKLSGDAHELLSQCADMNTLRQDILSQYPESNNTWWFETPNSMGKVSINLYINDESIYEKVKAYVNK